MWPKVSDILGSSKLDSECPNVLIRIIYGFDSSTPVVPAVAMTAEPDYTQPRTFPDA
jgi:hypothetical protein